MTAPVSSGSVHRGWAAVFFSIAGLALILGLALVENEDKRTGNIVVSAAATAAADDSASESCSLSPTLLSVMTGVANSALEGLTLMDPYNMTLKDVRLEKKIFFMCTMYIDIASNLQVSGISNSGIDALQCVDSTEDEGGVLYTFEAHVSVRGTLHVAGTANGDMGMCKHKQRSMILSFDVEEPKLAMRVQVRRQGLTGFTVDRVISSSMDYTAADNFQCSFGDHVDGALVGSMMSKLCPKMLSFLADKVIYTFKDKLTEHLVEEMNKKLKKYNETPVAGVPRGELILGGLGGLILCGTILGFWCCCRGGSAREENLGAKKEGLSAALLTTEDEEEEAK